MVALVFPGVWGNGYDISNKILQEDALQKGYSDLVNGSVLADLAAWQIPIVILGGLLLSKWLFWCFPGRGWGWCCPGDRMVAAAAFGNGEMTACEAMPSRL